MELALHRTPTGCTAIKQATHRLNDSRGSVDRTMCALRVCLERETKAAGFVSPVFYDRCDFIDHVLLKARYWRTNEAQSLERR